MEVSVMVIYIPNFYYFVSVQQPVINIHHQRFNYWTKVYTTITQEQIDANHEMSFEKILSKNLIVDKLLFPQVRG